MIPFIPPHPPLAIHTDPDSHAKVYEEFLKDDRLSFGDRRVYMAIGIALGDRPSGEVSLQQLSIMARLNITSVSLATRRLQRFGWIRKISNRGNQRFNEYSIIPYPEELNP